MEAESIKYLRGLSHFLLPLSFGAYCDAVEHLVNASSIKDLISTGSVSALPESHMQHWQVDWRKIPKETAPPLMWTTCAESVKLAG